MEAAGVLDGLESAKEGEKVVAGARLVSSCISLGKSELVYPTLK